MLLNSPFLMVHFCESLKYVLSLAVIVSRKYIFLE